MRSMKRRALVLSNEAAGHPFRRSLPAHVFAVPFSGDDEVQDNEKAALRWQMTGGDWRQFAAVYCLGFVAISIFFA